ncbi:hypothetical protein [Halomonas sp. E19]|jgi:hypothetical protein|uniref:hypothetical protein n=1 Tax=Halomonas sp. E19 TaxID=3397247 RepID=UPI004034A768
MKDMIYFNCCVDWDPKDVHVDGGLCDMIDEEVSITRRTFLAHVDPTDLHHVESMLGYAKHPRQGLTMAGDFHVSYHRSRLHGECVYYFKHSAIEYVFIDPESRLRPRWLNHYECSECGNEWSDEWSCQCDDRCPACDTSCSPIESDDLREAA